MNMKQAEDGGVAEDNLLQKITCLAHEHGWSIKSISGKRHAILVDSADRQEFMRWLEETIPGAWWDKTPDGKSSIGWIVLDGMKCVVKPASRQGGGSSGMRNEERFLSLIDKITDIG